MKATSASAFTRSSTALSNDLSIRMAG